MASATAALWTRARRALALALLVAAALLAVLNPWLAAFAVAGFALGWLVRYLTKSRRRLLTAVLVGFVLLAGFGVVGVLFVDYTRESGAPSSISEVAPVSYSAQATLETEREAFALRERLVVPQESLEQLRRRPPNKDTTAAAALRLAQQLARAGWVQPRFVGKDLELSREGRKSEEANFAGLTRRATVALPIPGDLGDAPLLVTEGTVNVVSPKHWVLATSPPSESKAVSGDREQRLVDAGGRDDEEVEVELAGPLFRNELGASLLGLSVSGGMWWGVLLLFGVLQDELRKLVKAFVGRLRRPGSATAPAKPSPPAQE